MTPQEAVDVMLGVFLAAWAPRAAVYSDVPAEVPTTQVPWARPVILHATSDHTLANDVGARRFDAMGLLWIQTFAPVGDGNVNGYQNAQLLLNAYRDARVAVWFRNIRLEEMGRDGVFSRYDIKADFEYEDVR